MEQGYSSDHAIKNAWNWGLGMLRAGIGGYMDFEKAEIYFRHLEATSHSLAELCNQYKSKS
jgi:hypothetical protein